MEPIALRAGDFGPDSGRYHAYVEIDGLMAMLNGNGPRGVWLTREAAREAANAIPGRRPNGHVAIVGIPDNPQPPATTATTSLFAAPATPTAPTAVAAPPDSSPANIPNATSATAAAPTSAPATAAKVAPTGPIAKWNSPANPRRARLALRR